MSISTRTTRYALVTALALGGALATDARAGQEPMIIPAQLSNSEQAELEALIAEHVQMTLSSMKPAEGQLFPTKVTATFPQDGGVVVELGRRFVLKADGTLNGAYVPDQLNMIDAVIYTMIAEVELGGIYGGIKYRFDGHDITYYYPELRPRTKETTTRADTTYPPFPPYFPPPVNDDPSRMYVPTQPYPTAGYTPPRVALNPGHGLYKLYNTGTLNPNYRWTTARSGQRRLGGQDHTGLRQRVAAMVYSTQSGHRYLLYSLHVSPGSRSEHTGVRQYSLLDRYERQVPCGTTVSGTNGSLGRHVKDRQPA